MHLTNYTDYSLRVLLFLASAPKGEVFQIKEIAEAYNISKNHLMKVVHELGKLQLIETIRGRNGGIRLRVAPSAINLGDLVRKTEDNLHLVECFDSENDQCVITSACKLKHVLQEALQAYLNVLDSYTLEDLTQNRKTLSKLLKL